MIDLKYTLIIRVSIMVNYLGECEFFQKNFIPEKNKKLSMLKSYKREDREMLKYARYVEEQNNSE